MLTLPDGYLWLAPWLGMLLLASILLLAGAVLCRVAKAEGR